MHRIAELFAGIGGVTGGFLDAGGYDPAVLIDCDPEAAKVFRSNFPTLTHRYHVRKVGQHITGTKLLDLADGELNGILGCPPCQGLSAAGNRDMDDSRNTLLFEMKRLVASIQPNFFVMENVPRLLRSPLYKEFADSLKSKYLICADSINAAEYGLPQLRRRAVVIGFHKRLDVNPSLPAPTHGGSGKVFDYASGKYVSPATSFGRLVLDLRPLIPRKGPEFHPPTPPLVTLVEALNDLPAAVPVMSPRSLKLATAEAVEYRCDAESEFQRVIRSESVHALNHRCWDHGPNLIKRLKKIPPGDCPPNDGSRSRNDRYFSQAYARLHRHGLARTITTNFHNPGGGRFTHYASPRTLTLREALRLQGFPDTFAFDKIFPSDAERLVGNAFPRLLAAVIGLHVAKLLS